VPVPNEPWSPLFEKLRQTKPETCTLSVIFEVLKARDDWTGHAPSASTANVVPTGPAADTARADEKKRPTETQEQGAVSKKVREQEGESDSS